MSLAVQNAEATMGRGGSSDDFYVNEITIDNASAVNNWIQPDGSVMEYIAKGDTVDINVVVKRGGGALQGSNAKVTIEMVHPIGFVMNTTSWQTTDMLGGQSYSGSYSWQATVAHSYLDVETNELSGGIIIRATVLNTADDRNDNDVMEKPLPVAISQDEMEAEGDPRDQTLPPAMLPTFYGGEYPAEGGGATGLGIWQEDSSSGLVGSKHWRHANADSDYPSASHSRLIFSYRSSSSQCGYGASLDGELSQVYFQYMCKMQLNSAGLVSAQMHVQTWGQLGAGDHVALELWRGNGAPAGTLSHNFSEDSPSSGENQWSNISWDPTDLLGGHSWSYGLLFHSDSSGATSGMHVDDFALFGIEKVSEYTLNISCDNPESGYTTPPNNILTMHCFVTNNGYMPAQVRIQSNVSNETWMHPSLPMIRIDSANQNQHGVNVVLPVVLAGNTTEMWINLSIPAGADVQQQVWETWWSDAGGTQLGEMGRISNDLAVTEQYGVHMSSTAPLLAASLGPGQTGEVPFKLLNSGNREAGYTVTSNFQEDGWTSFVTDTNGTIVQMPMPLGKGEEVELILNVTAPSDSSPGEIPFSLRAVCPSCGQSLFGNDVISKKVEVPTIRDFELVPEANTIVAPANGGMKVVMIDVLNLGNDDEAYSLELVQSNWKLQAYISTDETPILDAWDGETSIALNLPMPVGLAPGLYTARINAASIDDPSVSEFIVINVEVSDTSAVWVSNEEADQSFIPGSASQSMRFEVRNDGNQADRFEMSMDLPDGMNAIFEQLGDGNMTPMLDPGTSYNVTVTFDFDEGTNGQLILKVIATSVNDGTVSANGLCTYRVGSQNWIRIISTEATIIDEPGEYEVTVRVRNQYTEGQSVTMEIDQMGSNKYFRASIISADRDFWLADENTGVAEREVTLIFTVESTSLQNLDEDYVETSIMVWAKSNTVSDAASLEMMVTLKRMSADGADSTTDSQSSMDWVGIATWIVGGLTIIALLAILLVVLNGSEEEEESWAEDEGYEDNISSTYGSVAAAPTIGAGGIVEQVKAIPDISPPPLSPAPQPVVQTGPQVPAEGLPEGWTMEQWQHYGQQWLDNQR
ncbi:MAG: hypothetical protein QGI21_00850 [Candidatus Poseidoniaceae archaeon]|jgi:uncharacterized membrane protein|nr:hypothetical protein [Candidatus Poseidoniaceae archaeon]